MSASASTRLRQLATQYHGGELDLQSYRRLRAELLDRLTATDAGAVDEPDESSITLPKYPRPNAAPVPAAAPAAAQPVAVPPPAPVRVSQTTPPPPPPAPAAAKPQPAAPRASAPAPRAAPPAPAPAPQAAASAPATPARGGAGKIVLVLVLVAAIGGAAFWYFKLRPQQGTSPAAEQAAPTEESYRAINDFLAADDWSDDQIANFNSRWSTLPDDMRAAAIDELWYQDFVSRVRSQVKERRALTATSDRAGTVEGPLLALANSLGIDVSSPDAIVIPSRVPRSTGGEDRPATPRSAVLQPAASPASATAGKPAAAPPTNATTPAVATAAAPAGKLPAKEARPAAAPAAKPALVNPADVVNPDKCRVELVGSRKPRCRDALSVGGFGPYLALIPAGSYDMGSKQIAQEQPVHRVTIAKPFAIAEHETSQAEFQLFCEQAKHPCEAQPWQGADYPVVRVSWQDARDYVAWLSSVSGKTYRLATEAEWEFAARGGSTALFPSGEALSQTDAVFSVTDKLSAPWPRSRKINSNAFRLYHSIGNVREWVEDAWVPNFTGAPADGSARGGAGQHVVRGGAYSDSASKLRFTTREGADATTRDLITGFRVVREL